ncbi:MAG: SUMF1/EgtB/PvdO family nonheme iron enzyme [Polyangia bacterium]|nr:SUMF1/EgtB/PvdO family nonheme iron enzyme [Polyangia bacterium]
MATLPMALLAFVAACGPDGITGNDNNQSLERCGEGWILVPEGPFTMGIDEDDPHYAPYNIPRSSVPKHVVQMSDYCIMRTEVSVAEYRECVEAGGCELPDATWNDGTECNYSRDPGDRERHPVNCIGWDRSRAYCQWLGGDLPSDAQWEKAARGTDERFYPWGEATPDCSRANYDKNGSYNEDTGTGAGYGCSPASSPVTWEVGHLTSTKGNSPYGLKDMAGNVDEWVLDCYDRDFYAECAATECMDPVNLFELDCSHMIRGGSALSIEPEFLNTIEKGPASDISVGDGLRCVKSPAPGP